MASYTRDGSYGPRNIKSVTKLFEQRLRGVLERLNSVIREAVVERDIFGLRSEALARDDVDEPSSYQFRSDPGKIEAFTQWLREQLQSAHLSLVGESENQFVRRAYAEGVRRATRDVRDQGVDVDMPDIGGLEETLTHRRALQDLYTRTYDDLRGVSRDMADEMREELAEGLTEGENPRKVAKRLTDRVDSIGKNRSTLIARTELMNAHSDGEINRLRRVERDANVNVTVQHSQWRTARDNRVCSICETLEGLTFTLDELENGSFRLDGYDYQLKPPAHPNGRCVVTSQVGYDSADLPPIDERMSQFEAYSV